tara:strand:- start:172 stop:411 length:240 start_codon:yes stop_codon:yes gene_type:complete
MAKNIYERRWTVKLSSLPIDEHAEKLYKYSRLCGIKKIGEWIEVYERGWVPEVMLGLPEVIHPLTEEDIISQKNKGDDE